MTAKIIIQCQNCLSFCEYPLGNCNSCGKSFDLIDGIISYASGKTFWSIINEELMEELLEQTKNVGWKEALLTSTKTEIKDLYNWTESPSRADPSFYLPITTSSTILDLGSGLGSYTFPLSIRSSLVVAADSNLQTLKFIKLRSEQESIKNIIPIHISPIDDSILPFGSNQFDCVILNGVLEWVGSYKLDKDPKQLQLKCLKEINRILSHNGSLFIGIENRFGFNYFLGAPDDHLIHYSKTKKIAYTTLMPRFIADIVTRAKLKIPYRTYTHSKHVLKKMLIESGFKTIKFYYPELGYRALATKVIPFESTEIEKILNKKYGKFLLYRILSKLFGANYFCESFFLIASKE